jgi:outer membrane protein assembly factor BamB
VFISPTVVGDTVAIGSCAGSLYALRRNSGEAQWVYDTAGDGPGAQFHGEPILLRDAIIVPTDADEIGHLYSMDVRSGDVRWKVPFHGGVATSPLLVHDRIVVVSAEATVAAIDPSQGKVVWKVAPAGVTRLLPYIPSPATDGERVFFGDNTGKLFALDGANGKIIWRNDLPARLNTSLVVVGKTLIGATIDDFINFIDVDSGKLSRRVRLDGHPYGTLISSPPLLLILVKSDQAKLVAFDTVKGEIRWESSTPREWTTYRPLLLGSTVIVGNQDKQLCALNMSDGKPRWCRDISGVPRGLGVSPDGTLYVGTLSGKVMAFAGDHQ